MAKIRPVYKEGELYYPLTILDAVYDSESATPITLREILGSLEADLSVTIDSALDATSINPVLNKVVKAALDLKANVSDVVNKSNVVTSVGYANNKITKTINGSTTEVVDRATLIAGLIPATEKGAANGVAELDSTGKVPSSQLPSYVDDIIEGYYYNSKFYKESTHTTEITPETEKIYVDLSTNKTYRWSGTAYVQIKGDLALGESESTAYRGDRGKIAYDHASAKGSAFASNLYKITTNAQGHVTAATAVLKSDITALGIPEADVHVTEALYHYAPSADNGAELTASADGTAASYALNTTYNVVTGITLLRDAKGHVVGVKKQLLAIKDTNTTYSNMTLEEASTGTSTTGKLISAKVLVDTIVEKAVVAGDPISNVEYADVTLAGS